MISLQLNILYALIPAAAILIGTFISFFFLPKEKTLSGFQHFVAGILIAAVAIDLMPKIVQKEKQFPIIIGFILGALFMLFIQYLSKRLEKQRALGTTIAVLIDLFIDGTLLSIAFIGGLLSGQLITIALTFEALLLSLTISSTLKLRLTSLLFAAALPLGALIGTLFIQNLPATLLTETLSFGVAALLYLAAEELLTEAHKKPDSPLISSLFFLGFLVILILKLTIN